MTWRDLYTWFQRRYQELKPLFEREELTHTQSKNVVYQEGVDVCGGNLSTFSGMVVKGKRVEILLNTFGERLIIRVPGRRLKRSLFELNDYIHSDLRLGIE